ncbi:hypothetical protein PI124_g9654 [Phytophthora idaei]|nr:hypothetical protein PI125_g9771 [Phytophthora idaei]KAG3155958.1 hypothetical protein PI126_g8965 [Phytophthora idaei]KAG3245615.1 hypothetical protein PI124_g9654 [Phytophthora idaei]
MNGAVVSDYLPVLTSAKVVCRECIAVGGGVVLHVEKLIDGFLDTFSTQENALLKACSSGASVFALGYLYCRSWKGTRSKAIHVAAMAGYVHVLQWLVENHREDFVGLRAGCLNPIDRAAQHGHLDAVVWLHENYPEGYSSETLALAAQCGRVKVLRWLHTYSSVSCTSEAMVGAAAHNKLSTVKWLYRHGRHEDVRVALMKAAEHGHVSVVAWLYFHNGQSDAVQAMLIAARSGQLAVVKWLYQNARELSGDDRAYNLHAAVQLAATQGLTRIVVWLLKRPQGIDQNRHNKRRRSDINRGQSKRAQWSEDA